MKRVVVAALASAMTAMACAGSATGGGAHASDTGSPRDSAGVAASPRSDGGDAPGHGGPDARFVRSMIAHHAQALDMTALASDRAEDATLRRLARRIEISQEDEIAVMRRWLERRGEPAPPLQPPLDGGHHDHAPGMLAPEELDRLANASGAEFDRLFLEYMIRHHEGAIAMVEELLSAGGAAGDTELFRLVSHIDADQRAEIARMGSMMDHMFR